MFILRRITSEHKEINRVIGDSYNLVLKEKDPGEHKKVLEAHFGMVDNDDPEIYGFVTYDDGFKITPLYVKSTYFMMTGTGKTFANLTLK